MNEVINYYNSQDEDNRLSLDRAHQLEYLTTMKYIEKISPVNASILDACAGTGVYCFDLAKKGFQVTAGDLVQYNVEFIKRKNSSNQLLKQIYTGDILDLSIFPDESFDVVLCLGALYHLQNKADRRQAIMECKRVTKHDGKIVFAYLNRFASFMNNFSQHNDEFETILDQFYTGNKKVFYRSTPTEIEKLMSEYNISLMHNVGTDGTAFMYSKELESLSDKEYEKYLQYHFNTCEEKSILGYSLHGLYIGKKK